MRVLEVFYRDASTGTGMCAEDIVLAAPRRAFRAEDPCSSHHNREEGPRNDDDDDVVIATMAKRKRRARKSHVDPDAGHRVTEMRDADDGLLWVQEVQIRRKAKKPMPTWARWKSKFGFRRGGDGKKTKKKRKSGLAEADADRRKKLDDDEEGGRREEDEGSDDDESSEGETKRQYTVTSLKTTGSFYERILAKTRPDDFNYRPSRFFMLYINWTFQSSFFTVFLSFLAFFMILNLIFAALLLWAGTRQPNCIMVSGEIFGFNPDTKFADAFALSWTTFTTVGYGMIFTSTGTDYDHQKKCSAVVGLCTSESFVGLLYAGMCAAILFAKISRVQSHAQVSFCDAICVQYGAPVEGGGGKRGGADPLKEVASPKSAVSLESEMAQSPDPLALSRCPILKFQVVNELCNKQGGEIMDATLKVVASTNRADRSNHPPGASSVASYSKVELKEFEHPFFNRVWHGRHILDARSPLLTGEAKAMIQKNDGYWPTGWNNPTRLRSCLQFSDFIVTLTGISNVSAATVHTCKKYNFADVLVGYEFASVLYKRSDTGALKVDLSLINDVVEQYVGGDDLVADEVDDIDVDDRASTHSNDGMGGSRRGGLKIEKSHRW